MDTELREKIAGEITLSNTPSETIKKWREEFRISQLELSNFLDLSPSVISDFETGRRKSPSVSSIKKIVNALITIDERRGGNVIKKYQSGVPSDALIGIKDYDHDVNLDRAIKAITGKNYSHVATDRSIRGYTIVDGVKAILAFSYYEYSRLYGWSSERAIFFTDVKFGRSPMIAIRVHPLKPAAVIY
ncbi:MAG: helix-turn-helix domain-containing protein, partial [Thermoplasmata archaeon]